MRRFNFNQLMEMDSNENDDKYSTIDSYDLFDQEDLFNFQPSSNFLDLQNSQKVKNYLETDRQQQEEIENQNTQFQPQFYEEIPKNQNQETNDNNTPLYGGFNLTNNQNNCNYNCNYNPNLLILNQYTNYQTQVTQQEQNQSYYNQQSERISVYNSDIFDNKSQNSQDILKNETYFQLQNNQQEQQQVQQYIQFKQKKQQVKKEKTTNVTKKIYKISKTQIKKEESKKMKRLNELNEFKCEETKNLFVLVVPQFLQCLIERCNEIKQLSTYQEQQKRRNSLQFLNSLLFEHIQNLETNDEKKQFKQICSSILDLDLTRYSRNQKSFKNQFAFEKYKEGLRQIIYNPNIFNSIKEANQYAKKIRDEHLKSLLASS